MRLLSFLKNNVSDKAGLPPGSLIYVGDEVEKGANVEASIFKYDKDHVEEILNASASECSIVHESAQVYWINVDGVHDMDFIASIGKAYNLHPIMLEDIMNTTQRPKIEFYENGIHIVLKMITYIKESHHIDAEQVSMFLGENYVITFQEKFEDVFDPIRKRLKENMGRVRKRGADYLFYVLIDVIISNYLTALQGLEDKIDVLEARIYEDHSPQMIKEILKIKGSLVFLRKYIFPLRDVINALLKEEDQGVFEERTQVFVRDLQGQLIQVTELIETYREILTGLYELHFALNGQRMNEIMKVLTVVSSIFIPLTFIAGIYGMNFQYMPELTYHNGYFISLGVMGVIVAVLLWIFWRRKWL